MAKIDLRPMTLGEVLDRTFSLYKENFWLFAGIVAIPCLLLVFASLLSSSTSTATVAIHTDALPPGARVVLIDDLLATGGTSSAAAALVKKLGAQILEIAFLIELKFLNGRQKLTGYPVRSVIAY